MLSIYTQIEGKYKVANEQNCKIELKTLPTPPHEK